MAGGVAASSSGGAAAMVASLNGGVTVPSIAHLMVMSSDGGPRSLLVGHVPFLYLIQVSINI